MAYTSTRSILLMIIATLFISAGQLLWKLALNDGSFEHILSFISFELVLGFISYWIGFILMVVAFKEGELSVLYPIIATSYIWISLLSPLFFATDSMNAWKWFGVLILVISVSLLGFSREKNKEATYA